MRVNMLLWPLMAKEFYGVSSHAGSIKTNKNYFYVHSEEASACRTALSMPSGSYSGLATQELVHQKIK